MLKYLNKLNDRLQAKGFSWWIDDYLNMQEALPQLLHRFAEGFKAGQLSVKRKNKSGCCCIINDSDEIEVACGAHLNWRDKYEIPLMDLLAVIHRDGGQYVERYGVDQAVKEAKQIVVDAIVR